MPAMAFVQNANPPQFKVARCLKEDDSLFSRRANLGKALAKLFRMTMMNIKDEIIEWLQDAYAMERSQEAALERIHGNGDESIACRTSAAMHLTETRQHARIVESLIRSMGADVSSFKTGLGMMAEKIKGLVSTMSHDEQIKGLLGDYAIESFEIVCYSAIVAAAEIAGLSHITNACRQIILDEERMAESIRKELPRSVQEYFGATPMAKAA